jgi:3-oxoacyl-[acyl-carrier protein] reductase
LAEFGRCNAVTAQTVLVTGAGIGIGRATAIAFGRLGAHVLVTDVLAKEGEAVAAEIVAAGGRATFDLLDVTNTDAVEAVFAAAEAEHGVIDTVVANAGIARHVPVEQLTDALWNQTVDVDLVGVMRVFRRAVPGLRKRGAGSLVALSSIMGIAYGWDKHVHYSAAKAGVIGLVRGLAVELASQGIRVNGIAPGYIRTAQLLSEEHSLGAAGAEQAPAFIPMGRLGEPEDIADVVLFLASEAARYITGQVIVVDGGLLVGRY